MYCLYCCKCQPFFVRILLYNSTLIMLNLGRIQTTDFIWIKFEFTQGPSWSSSSCSLTRCWSGLKLVSNLVMWTNLFRIKFVCIMQLDLGHFDRIKLLLIKVLIWRWPYSVVDKILKCFYYLKKEKQGLTFYSDFWMKCQTLIQMIQGYQKTFFEFLVLFKVFHLFLNQEKFSKWKMFQICYSLNPVGPKAVVFFLLTEILNRWTI